MPLPHTHADLSVQFRRLYSNQLFLINIICMALMPDRRTVQWPVAAKDNLIVRAIKSFNSW
jgi:hypothetical protein